MEIDWWSTTRSSLSPAAGNLGDWHRKHGEAARKRRRASLQCRLTDRGVQVSWTNEQATFRLAVEVGDRDPGHRGALLVAIRVPQLRAGVGLILVCTS